jgi:hypothetical protein
MTETPEPDSATVPGDEVRRQRHCGRCQLTFPGDLGLHPTAQLGWWLCPPCHEALLGLRRS